MYEFVYSDSGDGSLLSAEPEFVITDQPTDVEVLYFDRATKRIASQKTGVFGRNTNSDKVVISEDVKLYSKHWASTKAKARKPISGAGSRVRFTAFGQVLECFTNRPFGSKKQAQAFVERYLRTRERDFLILHGKIIGIPDVRVRQVHMFRGMSKRLDGAYRLTNVKHELSPGSNLYTIEFVAFKAVKAGELKRKKVSSSKVKTNVGVNTGSDKVVIP